ncbi:MAG: hypothetical protein ACYC4D_09685 [Thermoleophilia bacterium]
MFLVLAAIAAILSGCGLFEGYAVENYLKKVARIQQESDESLLNLDQDLNALGGDLVGVEATVLQLRADGEALVAARVELEALEAPEAAAPFKNHLLELYTEGGSLLEELVKTGEYRLAIEPLINQYETSSGSFSENIKSASGKAEVINCLHVYEGSIAAMAEKAQVLQPPLLSSSSHKRFIANLNTVREGLAETISGLESEDAAVLEAASNKMAGAGETNESLRLQIISEREADIRSYNAKIQGMTELWQQIVQDQLALRERFARN